MNVVGHVPIPTPGLPEGWAKHRDLAGIFFFWNATLDRASWIEPEAGVFDVEDLDLTTIDPPLWLSAHSAPWRHVCDLCPPELAQQTHECDCCRRWWCKRHSRGGLLAFFGLASRRCEPCDKHAALRGGACANRLPPYTRLMDGQHPLAKRAAKQLKNQR